MKHISELIIQPRPASSVPLTNANANARPVVSERDIDIFWKRMTKIYGHRWISNYGDADDGTWELGLKSLTPEQLGVGLERCLMSAEPWPPTLPEFRALCEPAKPLASYHREWPALPTPVIDGDKVALGIKAMRERVK